MTESLKQKIKAGELTTSLAEAMVRQPREVWLRSLKRMSDKDALSLLYDWRMWARPKQLPPSGDWLIWVILAGRGWGKTITGAQFVRAQVESGQAGRVALAGATAADVRDVMIEGETGILNVCPPWNRPKYEPSKRRLTWPNGATAMALSAENPARFRGPQFHIAWADELAAWQYTESWDMLLLTVRLGSDPRIVVTTTPRPLPHIKSLLTDATATITTGSTYENMANLAAPFIQRIIKRYEGTRLGRQELYAQILDDVPGALWTRDLFEQTRVGKTVDLVRIVVGVDPAASSMTETGIVVVGLGVDGHVYALEDMTIAGSPAVWGKAAVTAYLKYGADRIVGEVNNGGEMVGHVIATAALEMGPEVYAQIAYKAVHASRGKYARAEPVAALYEQGRAHNVGYLGALEDECCTWVPGEGLPSPNRLDALVWAVTELMFGEQQEIVTVEERVEISRY